MKTYDVVIVGAGFAGLYMLHRARTDGLTAHVYEAGDGVGGTWYWNRYPGARCDLESLDYSFSFDDGLQQDWVWSERYATQPEIRRYLDHVADRFDLRKDITLGTRVSSCVYDGDTQSWALSSSDGQLAEARHVVMATGSFSTPRLPDLPGIDTFGGRSLHTAAWPDDAIDFTGRRVAIIGTGSSGVQTATEIAKQADQLYVMQRTPAYVAPAHHDRLDPETLAAEKAVYGERRARQRESFLGTDTAARPDLTMSVSVAERRAEFDRRWQVGGTDILFAFSDLFLDEMGNAELSSYAKERIKEAVHDRRTGDVLASIEYPIGTRRLVLGPGYYDIYNQPNVELVDVKTSPIQAVTPTGLQTTESHYEVDDLIFATGFDVGTGAVLAMDIQGRAGIKLAQAWADGPVTYLGVQTPGFPNMYFVNGPGSPSIITNMALSIEHHVEFISGLLATMRARGAATIEPTPEAATSWMQHVREVVEQTLFNRTPSYFNGANVPGKPKVFLAYVAGVAAYREICAKVVANGYEGLRFAPAPTVASDEANTTRRDHP